MRYHVANTAAIYYHHKYQRSTCVGIMKKLDRGYSVRVLEPDFIKALLKIPNEMQLVKDCVLQIDELPAALRLPTNMLGTHYDTIINNTYVGKQTKTSLERLATVQQVIGRVIEGSFTLTPVLTSLQGKNHAVYEFLLALPYEDGKVQKPSSEVISLLQKETTLHIRNNFLKGREAFVVTDYRDRVVGYLPMHIEEFCRAQYNDQLRPPQLRITKAIGITETKENPPYYVVEVSGNFFINTSNNTIVERFGMKPLKPEELEKTKKGVGVCETAMEVKKRISKQVKFVTLACMNDDNAIGKDNELPWHIPEDLQLFKKITNNEILIVGRKTFESLPRNMPRRNFIVISGGREHKIIPRGEHTIVVKDVQQAMEVAIERAVLTGKRKVYVIGGANVYEQMLPYSHTAIITRCKNPVKNPDVFFPKLPENFIQQYHPTLIARNEFGPVEVYYYQNTAISSF